MKTVLVLILVLVGAMDIRNAVKTYKDGMYFLCGLNTMLAVWMSIILSSLYIK